MMAAIMILLFIFNCVLSRSDAYFTASCNTKDGHACQFPFSDGKQTYYGCINRRASLQCKTKSNSWEICQSTCPRAAVKFTVHPIILIHENPMVLECAARGSPNPAITWFRKSKKGRKEELSHTMPVLLHPPAITFSHLVLHDNSDTQYEYQCEAYNGHKRAVSRTVNITTKATFLSLSSEDKEGDDLEVLENSNKNLLLVIVSLLAVALLIASCFLLFRNFKLRRSLSTVLQSNHASVMTTETSIPYPAGTIYNTMYHATGRPEKTSDHTISDYSSYHVYSTIDDSASRF